MVGSHPQGVPRGTAPPSQLGTSCHRGLHGLGPVRGLRDYLDRWVGSGRGAAAHDLGLQPEHDPVRDHHGDCRVVPGHLLWDGGDPRPGAAGGRGLPFDPFDPARVRLGQVLGGGGRLRGHLDVLPGLLDVHGTRRQGSGSFRCGRRLRTGQLPVPDAVLRDPPDPVLRGRSLLPGHLDAPPDPGLCLPVGVDPGDHDLPVQVVSELAVAGCQPTAHAPRSVGLPLAQRDVSHGGPGGGVLQHCLPAARRGVRA